MKIDLKEYFEERDKINRSLSAPGPFVTFSRQYGCEAIRIARLLIQHLNDLQPGPVKKFPWRYVSKEILEESSRELGLTPFEIDHRVMMHHSDVINSIFSSFTEHYNTSDKAIQKTIREIILTYAKKGNVVIIGRGGSIVTRGMNNGLRIRLIAPLEWRARAIMRKRKSMNIKEAMDLVDHFDENRIRWMEHLVDQPYDESVFDLVLNVSSLSDHEIVHVIADLMQDRGMVSKSLAGREATRILT